MKAEIERLRAELAASRDSEDKYKRLIETTDTGFVILDEGGRVLDANDLYVKLTGHARLEQILGRCVTDWTAPHDLERNGEEVRRCLTHGAVRNLEIDYLGPDGRLTPIEINATVRDLPTGRTILTVCRDISDRRRSAEALRSSEHRYRATIDSMAELIHVVDPQLRITLVNRTGVEWLRQFGVDSEMVGRGVFEVFSFLPDRVRDEYNRVFSGEGPLFTVERTTVDGLEVVTETRKIPLVEDSRVTGVVTVVRDVTEQTRAQERLRQTEKMQALGQLAGGIAHDFNNQLTAILGFAELLERRLEDPQAKEFAQTIARIADRSADLTRQLLTFARKGRAHSVTVDIHALLREVVAMLHRTVDPRIAIECRFHALQAETVGDPSQLQSAFLNLALNARDAMPQGGVLSFSTDSIAASDPESEPMLRVRVSDSGEGMSEEVRRRLFEPFFTTKEPGQGTGMGLAGVYSAVRNHQGSISVESEPGLGSTFSVRLPLAASFGLGRAVPVEDPPVEGRGHILVVDDEPSVLQMTREALVSLGYKVTARSNSAEALAFYRAAWQELDLVLLDVRMPTVSGTTALAEMRAINPSARAILVSGHPIGREEQRWIDEEGIGFLPKPYSLAKLAGSVALGLRNPTA